MNLHKRTLGVGKTIKEHSEKAIEALESLLAEENFKLIQRAEKKDYVDATIFGSDECLFVYHQQGTNFHPHYFDHVISYIASTWIEDSKAAKDIDTKVEDLLKSNDYKTEHYSEANF